MTGFLAPPKIANKVYALVQRKVVHTVRELAVRHGSLHKLRYSLWQRPSASVAQHGIPRTSGQLLD